MKVEGQSMGLVFVLLVLDQLGQQFHFFFKHLLARKMSFHSFDHSHTPPLCHPLSLSLSSQAAAEGCPPVTIACIDASSMATAMSELDIQRFTRDLIKVCGVCILCVLCVLCEKKRERTEK